MKIEEQLNLPPEELETFKTDGNKLLHEKVSVAAGDPGILRELAKVSNHLRASMLLSQSNPATQSLSYHLGVGIMCIDIYAVLVFNAMYAKEKGLPQDVIGGKAVEV